MRGFRNDQLSFQVEGQATDILQSKLGLKMELENLQKKAMEEKPVIISEDNSLELAKVGLRIFKH